MTKHDLRGSHEISTLARHSTFDNFVHSIEPLISSNKLKTILFQFPPFFLILIVKIWITCLILEN